MMDKTKNDQTSQEKHDVTSSTKSGGHNQILDRAMDAAAQAKDIAQQRFNAAREKFEAAGGVDGLMTKGKAFVADVKAGFVPDDGATGFKGFMSRVKKLWKSGGAGKITVAVVAIVLVLVLWNFGCGGSSGESTGISKKHGLVIKGFYTGMPLTEALELVNGKYSNVFTEFSIPEEHMAEGYPMPSGKKKIMWMHPLLGHYIEVDGVTFDKCFIHDNKIVNGEDAMLIGDDNGNLKLVRFPRSIVDPLFNVADMTAEEFAQVFVDSYGISEMKPHVQGDMSGWMYTSPKGCKVAITDTKSLLLMKVATAAERKLD